MKVQIKIQMELLSDTIFGSGFSTPGGEDIGVSTDEQGFPYLKGSTFKGLLRESAENLVAWTDMDISYPSRLFGEEGWDSELDDHRIQLTALSLAEKPETVEDCFDTRAFTQLEQGIAKEGTLHLASCIRKGLKFEGELYCHEEDAAFLEEALKAIHYVGTMRHRGFGSVQFSTRTIPLETVSSSYGEHTCLRYRVVTQAPVLMTDMEHSNENTVQTKDYLSGSAIRGMVISHLAKKAPQWFLENKIALLSDQVRFSDAYPIPEAYQTTDISVIPSPMGFYENTDGSGLEFVLGTGNFSPSKKRAKLGSFCCFRDNKIEYWDAATDNAMRISLMNEKSDGTIFQTEYLCQGQVFEGYITLDIPTLSPYIEECFEQTVWLGADRYQGYGKCKITCQPTALPSHISQYSISHADSIGTELYMMLLSPTSPTDETGAPCAFDDSILSRLLETDVTIVRSETSVAQYQSYNRTWGCFSPGVTMYERGSIFKLHCSTPPKKEALLMLQQNGIGIRRAEGFGQILFLSQSALEQLTEKERYTTIHETLSEEAIWRRKRLKWIREKSEILGKLNISPNKIGTLQTIYEKAIANHGDMTEYYAFLQKNTEEKGVAAIREYKPLITFVTSILEQPELLPTANPDSPTEQLKLLCMVFNHNRKKGV